MPLAKKMDGSQENVNRIITFGSMPSYREDKLQELQRRQQDTPPKLPVDSSQPIGDLSTFIELSPDNLTRVPEKGILKHGRPDNWEDGDDQGDENNVDSSSDVERTLKNINGYHEEILEALHSASQRMGDSKRSPSQESHKSVVDMNYSALGSVKGRDDQRDDDLEEPMPVPIRIRNLEDLLRQLEHHPLQQQQQHMSPACSDEIRLSEPEADRHYLLGRQDRSGSEGKVDPGLQYLLGRLQASGASSAKRGHYSLEEDDDVDDQSGDDEGSTYSSHQLVRSASEEALPVTSRRDYSYARKSKARRVPEPCDYAPSPPPSEDSYANSSEENAFLPPPAPPSMRGARTAKVEPETLGPPSAVSTGSLPSGAKRKGKKKFPEYKMSSLRNQRW
ncbi:UNVERIFIED_CONTAM: hypothetical protein NCL1_19208 [Trichonephila clavipes]